MADIKPTDTDGDETEVLAVDAAPNEARLATEWRGRSAVGFWFVLARSSVKAFMTQFLSSRRAVAGAVILLVLAFAAIFASVLTKQDPSSTTAEAMQAPNSQHLFGTDNIGRDVYALVLHGTRYSLSTGIIAAILALVIGALFGSIAGYLRGPAEWLLMRVVDLFQMLPALVLALFVIALFGSNFWLVVLVIGIVIWPLEARIVYGQFVVLRERNYVQAALVAGASRRRVIFSEILPNALPPVIVQVALDAGLAILIQAALGFLGLGNPNDPSWGQLLYIAQSYLQSGWWMSIFPGLGIFLAVMGFGLLGDGLNEMYNPTGAHRRMRRRLRRNPAATAAEGGTAHAS